MNEINEMNESAVFKVHSKARSGLV